MKHRVTHLSPHHNAKVVAFLLAACAAIFMFPMMGITALTTPREDQPPVWFFLLLPFIYLVIAYVAVIVGCAVYNRLQARIGGLEYETTEMDADRPPAAVDEAHRTP